MRNSAKLNKYYRPRDGLKACLTRENYKISIEGHIIDVEANDSSTLCAGLHGGGSSGIRLFEVEFLTRRTPAHPPYPRSRTSFVLAPVSLVELVSELNSPEVEVDAEPDVLGVKTLSAGTSRTRLAQRHAAPDTCRSLHRAALRRTHLAPDGPEVVAAAPSSSASSTSIRSAISKARQTSASISR